MMFLGSLGDPEFLVLLCKILSESGQVESPKDSPKRAPLNYVFFGLLGVGFNLVDLGKACYC